MRVTNAFLTVNYGDNLMPNGVEHQIINEIIHKGHLEYDIGGETRFSAYNVDIVLWFGTLFE